MLHEAVHIKISILKRALTWINPETLRHTVQYTEKGHAELPAPGYLQDPDSDSERSRFRLFRWSR